MTQDTKTDNPENDDLQEPDAEIEIVENAAGHDQEVQDPNEQLEALENKLKRTHERLLRTAADLDNLRKRSRREIEDATARGRSETLVEILPVIDSIDLALKSANPDGPAAAIIDGVEMVRKQFLQATERFGLKPITAEGEVFDPNFHEAVAQVPSEDVPPGQVVSEMRKGYMLGTRLLRPAMVMVSQGIAAPEEVAQPDTDLAEAELADPEPSAANSHSDAAESLDESAPEDKELSGHENEDPNE